MRYALIAASLVLFAGTAAAQDGPSFAESFYLMPADAAHPQSGALEVCAQNFARPLMASDAFIERNSAEVSETISECVEDTSSSTFTRQCELAIASSDVDLMFFFDIDEVEGGWLVSANARSPMLNAGVWVEDTVATGTDARLVAREACAELAEGFLESRGLGPEPEDLSGVTTTVAGPGSLTTGLLEIMNVTPSPVAVYVNGEEVGNAPNQFAGLPVGEVEVELRTPGFAPWVQTVDFEAGEMTTLNGISLDPLPATVIVTANVHAADLIVGGLVVGQTVLETPVSVEVAPSADAMIVDREGYAPYTIDLALSPGSTSRYEVELALRPEGPGNVVTFQSRSSHTYEIEVETDLGLFRCEQPISPGIPCTIQGIPTGRAEVIVSGDTDFTRHIDIEPGTSVVEIDHNNSRVGRWIAGGVTLAGAAALGVGGYQMSTDPDCNNSSSTSSDSCSGAVMAYLGVAALLYGGWYYVSLLEQGPPRVASVTHLAPPPEVDPYDDGPKTGLFGLNWTNVGVWSRDGGGGLFIGGTW